MCQHGHRDTLNTNLTRYFNKTQFGASPLVKVKGCSPPTESFSWLFRVLGLAKVRALVVSRSQERTRRLQADTLAGLEQLHHLGLANNGLEKVDRSFFVQTPNIRILDLSANRGIVIEDGTFRNLKMLEELRLMSCNIEDISEEIFQDLPSLSDLNLHDNKLSFLPEFLFSKVPSLSRLTLSKNELRTLPEKLFHALESLNEINLSFNDLEKVPSKLFRNNKNLTEIVMAFTGLMELPKNFLSGCKELRKLTISRSKLTELPPTLLRDATKLEKIDFSYNNIQSLPEIIFEGLENLQELILTSNNIKRISEHLFNPTNNLRKLLIQKNDLEEIDENSFRRTNLIEEIDMSRNNITFEDTECFKSNNFQKLRTLDLSHNLIKLINMDFHLMSKLQKLNLNHNIVGPILRPEDINFKLTFGLLLDLSYNKIEYFDLRNRFETVDNVDNFLLNISGNPIRCDCLSTELKLKLAGGDGDSLYEKSFSLTDDLIICGNNSGGHQALQHMDYADLKCPIDSGDCPAHCSCEKNTYYREMIVNCSGQNLTKFPENVKLEQSLDAISLHLENNQLSSLADGNFEKYYASVSQLYLSNNRIVKFDDFMIPAGLRLLNLDHNKIKAFTKKDLQRLESLVIRNNLSLALSSNNLSCTCDNKELYHFLINRQGSVAGE